MSRFSKALIVLLLLLGAGYYWLLVDDGPASAPIRTIDIAQVRKAAVALPGDRPIALEYAVIATRRVPGALLAAGTGLRQITTGVMAWRIATPRGGIVVDSGLSPADAKRMGYTLYDKRAEALVGRWMDDAELIMFTHEHIDHVGGFLDRPHFENVAAKAVLSAGIVQGMTALWRENAQSLPTPRTLAPIEPIAPGVVLIQTPGHTPASQMIYVQLQNGREYLFAGDTASLANNVILKRPRARLLTDWVVKEDRVATLGWIEGLNALRSKNEKIVIIPSHDPEWIAATAQRDGFTAASTQPGP
ncbi:glyoxylase-like metal-dependent hydrolase (beta-lactamase superfamily II) [Novosphingobium hassiacum]|uniref:Glyoxylase-like metal-dependent hydrolase (Beta-lactamase superfamily II) n=1 Tax=Novosphingobium hassiacum TaxID=173676 RepID=A0A7W5ZXC0_9SPHN|nr:MBL fold metallo-hydrolase [Novosphingobium hassiacum]MBB3860249.1 glyoxylase-like metal-dependent hydrolase (beta-lactamase superfamily II) [Novosphingobium hassiacum]